MAKEKSVEELIVDSYSSFTDMMCKYRTAIVTLKNSIWDAEDDIERFREMDAPNVDKAILQRQFYINGLKRALKELGEEPYEREVK